jgi:hypothetical protein
MKKNTLISLAIFFVTFLLPFRFAVLDVAADAHGLSTFGVFFTGVGFLAGFYYLLKDDGSKGHEGHESSH